MRRILLDTQSYVTCLTDPESLGQQALSLVLNPSNEIYVSAATIWEISARLERGELSEMASYTGPEESDGMRVLDITSRHAVQVRNLNQKETYPFTRMLIAQAQAEGLSVLTDCPTFSEYNLVTISSSI